MASMGTDELKDCSMCANSEPDLINTSTIYCGSNNIIHQSNFSFKGKQAAESCDGFKNMLDDKKGFIENIEALRYVLAGKCEFTVVSGKTGMKLGYKLTKKKANQVKDGGSEFIYYLNTKLNNEMVYCGVLFFDEPSNSFKFGKGARGQLQADHLNVKSILYILNNLCVGNTNLNMRIYHVGKCGRCGRALSTPESILTGLGPECSRQCGVPRVKVLKKDFI